MLAQDCKLLESKENLSKICERTFWCFHSSLFVPVTFLQMLVMSQGWLRKIWIRADKLVEFLFIVLLNPVLNNMTGVVITISYLSYLEQYTWTANNEAKLAKHFYRNHSSVLLTCIVIIGKNLYIYIHTQSFKNKMLCQGCAENLIYLFLNSFIIIFMCDFRTLTINKILQFRNLIYS